MPDRTRGWLVLAVSRAAARYHAGAERVRRLQALVRAQGLSPSSLLDLPYLDEAGLAKVSRAALRRLRCARSPSFLGCS